MYLKSELCRGSSSNRSKVDSDETCSSAREMSRAWSESQNRPADTFCSFQSDSKETSQGVQISGANQMENLILDLLCAEDPAESREDLVEPRGLHQHRVGGRKFFLETMTKGSEMEQRRGGLSSLMKQESEPNWSGLRSTLRAGPIRCPKALSFIHRTPTKQSASILFLPERF